MTDLGRTNDYVQMKWFQELYDPATERIARSGLDQHLLFSMDWYTRVIFARPAGSIVPSASFFWPISAVASSLSTWIYSTP